MGNSSSKEDENWRHNITTELKELRLQRENDRKVHQEEMRRKESDLEKKMRQKESHFEKEMRQKESDLQEKNQEIALLGKINQKRSKLKQKKPGDSDIFPEEVKFPNRLFISIFGEIGIGKTSLTNSIKYAIHGGLKDAQRIQTAHEEYHGSFTMESLEVVLTDHLSVIDNRGINSERAENTVLQDDVIRQMEGTYKKGAVTWQSIAPSQGKEAETASYCSVVVFSAHNANVVRQYRSFIHRLRDWQGHFPLAVITHVDEVSSKDVRLALQTGGIGGIYEVANITSDKIGRDTLTPDHQYQLLQLLEKCLSDGDTIFMRRQGFEQGFINS